MTNQRVWLVSITERYGELETVTRHFVRATDWSDAIEAGREICAYAMRGDDVCREDVNAWSYLGFEQAARVTDAVEVNNLRDVIAVMGVNERPTGPLPEIGRLYDLVEDSVPSYRG